MSSKFLAPRCPYTTSTRHLTKEEPPNYAVPNLNYAEMNTENLPTNLEGTLPRVLKDSKLPWKPVFDDQAPAPRDDDSWTCLIGPFRFELDAWDYSWLSTNPNPGSLTFSLRLFNTAIDRELDLQLHNSLLDAITSAEGFAIDGKPLQICPNRSTAP